MARVCFSPVKVASALLDCDGNVTATAKKLRCSPATVDNYVRRFPLVAEAKQQARERTLDIVENQLVEKAKSGESWAVCFFLKCQGGSQGY
jgi:hypothetical protein